TTNGSDNFSADVGLKANNTIGQADYQFTTEAKATETTTGDDECDTSDADNVKIVDTSTTTHGADDHPTAFDNKQCVNEGATQNVMIIADVSGSMDDTDIDPIKDGFQTRLQLEKDSLTSLVNQYAALDGTVTITLIAFASGGAGAQNTPGGTDDNGARDLGTFTFSSISDPGYAASIAAINSLAIGMQGLATETEYDDALILAQNVLTTQIAGQADGTTNTVYFLSDGVPNPLSNGADATTWKSFVNANNVEVVAVGIGAGASTAELDKVEDHTDKSVVISDQGDLSGLLTNTAGNAHVSGNVLLDPTEEAGISPANDPVGSVDTFGNDGAGAPKIVDLKVDGVDYNEGSKVDGSIVLANDGNTITVETKLGGILQFNFENGDYTYTAPDKVDHGTSNEVDETFTYTIQDKDGDTDPANLVICIKDNVEPPTVTMGIGADGKGECVEEDSKLGDPDNQVAVHAAAQNDDALTKLVITGFTHEPGWHFDLTGLQTKDVNVGASDLDASDGTITLVFNANVKTFDGTFSVEPPADSDVDLGTLTATATAAAAGDPTETLSTDTKLDVTVDANADQPHVTVFTVADSGKDGSFSPNETGTAHVHADFGDFKDGSETHSVTVDIGDGFTVTDADGGVVTIDGKGTHVTFDVPNGTGSLDKDIGIQADSNISPIGDHTFTATATATETTTGDDECDTSPEDNIATDKLTTNPPVVDDHPTAFDNKQCVTESGIQNVVIIADVSGSMDDDDIDPHTDGKQTRLDLEKSSLTALVDKYAALSGPVTITLIAFASGHDHTAGGNDTDGAVNLGTFTFDSTSDPGYAQAIAAINSLAIGTLVTGTETEYDDALITAQNFLESQLPGQAAGTTNTVYFLSDGQPNPASNDAAHTGWKPFVDAHGIEVVAVGIGADIAGNAGAIAKLAEVEDHNDAPIVVDDQGDLAAALTNTVVNSSVSGNVITDPTETNDTSDPIGSVDTFGNDGAGAPKIISLVHDGHTYDLSDAVGGEGGTVLAKNGDELTIETKLGGTLTFDFDTGDYTYTAPADVDSSKGEVDETFTYTIQDKDGDTDPANLVICIQDKVEPPTVTMAIGADGKGECVEEDSKVGDADNQVAVHAAAQGDDTLTQLVITGLNHQPGWTFDFTNLKTAGVNLGLSEFDTTDGKIALVFNAGVTSFDGKFGVQPPADSDVDLGTLTATATAVASGDPTQTLDSATNLDVTVDANADPTHVTVFTVSDSGGNGTFSPNETGTVHVHATFGDFTDGSETHTVTLDVPVGFAVTNAAGGSVTTDVNGTHVTFTVPNGTGSLDTNISVKAGNNISSSDNVQFHATATATETKTGDDECDTSAKDNIATDTGTVITHTFDDHPIAYPNSNSTADTQPQDINLVIVFDRSGSMADDPGVPGYSSRLELAKAAVAGLFEAYQSVAGDLHIKIVDFSDTTGHSVWLNSPEEANAYLAQLEADGTTHYNDAIQATIGNYNTVGDPVPPADLTEVYFISDGKPNPQSQSLHDQGTVGQWEDFLRDNNVDQAFAIGVGNGIPANDPDLEDVAYKDANHDGVDDGNSSIVVTDQSQLLDTLVGTVAVAGPPVHGNVLTDPVADVFGADGKGNGGVGLLSILVGSVTYTYDKAADHITNNFNATVIAGADLIANTTIGTLDFNFGNGDYTLTPVNLASDTTQDFLYTIVDGDGDKSAANLELTVTDVGGGGAVTPLSHIGTDNNDTINESGSKADIIISGGDGNDILTGGAHNDHIQGGDGDDKLVGNDGNDILIGGAGNDTLVAGSGIDFLFGGDGDDLLVVQDTVNFGHVSGGGTDGVDLSGKDTHGDILAFDGTLDLTKLANDKIEGIETISMTEAQGGSAHAADTLTLNSQDVIDLGTGHFNPTGSALSDQAAIKVDGEAADTLNLTGGNWAVQSASNVPSGYTLYVHDAGGSNEDAYVLVQTAISVHTS
ncbi:MAG TPA: VWA domain-containing protein, partial [Candidatus Angelobacter sp.]|nr:VWA domain-containing protein [Candidatus Angelobacter sp.]